MDDPVGGVALATGPRTAQDHIDEVPAWKDGTQVFQAPITTMQ